MTEPIKWRGHEIAAESPFAWRASTPAIEILVEHWTNPVHADNPFYALLSVEHLDSAEARGATQETALESARARLLAQFTQVDESIREAFGP